jgi:hypothetical protein
MFVIMLFGWNAVNKRMGLYILGHKRASAR